MGAKFILEGSGSGAVKAVSDLNKALDEAEKKADKAAKSTKAMANEAKRIAESVDPQHKYNNQIAKLAELVTKAGLSTDHARQAAVRYRQELDNVSNVGKRVFGAEALTNLSSMAAGYLTVSKAVGAVVAVMKHMAEEKEKAAQRDSLARAGLGSLSQLSGGDPAKFQALVAEARGMVGSAVPDENAAGELLFRLVGAGLNKEDRAFAAGLKAAGTLQNVGGGAEAYSAMKTSLGLKEVGTFREFMSKGLEAAGPAPGSFEQLPIAAAAAGGKARALGISDEFLLAATTILGMSKGSIEEGGTQLDALLRATEKSGVKGIKGIGGVGLIELLSKLPESQQGYGGVLGERDEAVTALRTLRLNLPELRALEAKTIAAQSGDLAGRAAGLPGTDPQLAAAMGEAQATGQLNVAKSAAYGATRNVLKAIRSERRTMLMNKGENLAVGVAESLDDRDFVPGDAGADSEIRGAYRFKEDYSPATQKLITDYLRRIADSNERMEKRERGRATTRQE